MYAAESTHHQLLLPRHCGYARSVGGNTSALTRCWCDLFSFVTSDEPNTSSNPYP